MSEDIVRIEREIIGGGRSFPSEFGPAYGKRGHLTYRGPRKVQCHICGKYYCNLGLHVKLTHEMEPDDYRREFGLASDVGLVSEWLHRRFQEANGPRLKKIQKEGTAKRVARLKELWKDEEWALKQRIRSSEAQGGLTIAIRTCAVCGSEYRARLASKRRTCSSGCSAVQRSQSQNERRPITESTRTKMREAHRLPRIQVECQICGEMFDATATMAQRRKVCGRECRIEITRRRLTGRLVSPDALATKTAKRRSTMNRNPATRLGRTRELSNSKLWMLLTQCTPGTEWTRERVAESAGVSVDYASAMLSKLTSRGELVRLRRGLYGVPPVSNAAPVSVVVKFE